jgi:O-antigen/teichoic acid export membrane protein
LIVSVGFIVTSEVEVMFLSYFGDLHGAGQFKVAYQLALGAVLLVPGVFGALLLPMMANALGQSADAAGRRFVGSTAYLALLAAPLVAFSAVFGGSVIQLLYGGAYATAGHVFAICVAGIALVTVTQGASSFLISADRQGAVLVLVLATGALKILLDAILIGANGLPGAVIAFVVVCIVNAASLLYLTIRASGHSLQWGRLARVCVAGALAGLALLPLRGHLPPVAEIAVGGLVLLLLYVPLTLVLACWTRDDIEHVRALLARRGRHARAGVRVLDWAYRRAGGRVVQ